MPQSFTDAAAPSPVTWRELLAHTFEHVYYCRLGAYRRSLELDPIECARRVSIPERESFMHLLAGYFAARKTMIASATVVAVAMSRQSTTKKHWFLMYYVPHTAEVAEHMRRAGVGGGGMWLTVGSFLEGTTGGLQAGMPDPLFCKALDRASQRGDDGVLLPAMPTHYELQYVGVLTDTRRERLAKFIQHMPNMGAIADGELELTAGPIPGFFYSGIGLDVKYNLLTNNCGTVASWFLGESTQTCQVLGFSSVSGNLVGLSLADVEAVHEPP